MNQPRGSPVAGGDEGAKMETKACSKCGSQLPATAEYFYRQKGRKYGLTSWCKTCQRIYQQARKDELTAYKKAYYEAHKDELLTQNNAYHQAHKDEIRAYLKAYGEDHKDELNAYKKAYYEAHKDEIKARVKAYRESHKEEIRAYQATHSEQSAIKRRRRRARKLSATVAEFDEQKWLELQPRPLRCYLCGKLIRKTQRYHVEHRIPLSRGGPHAPWNLGITHAKCNLSKHAKTPSEYAPDRFRPELPL